MTGNRLKLNNDQTEALVLGPRRRFIVSQDGHWRVGTHDISFKSHVKSLGVYIDATLSPLVGQRILRSEELALFAISWRGKSLFSWCVPSFSVVWTIATLYSLTSLLIKCTAFKKIKIMQPKSFFAKANKSMLHHFSKHFLAPSQRKDTFQDSHLCLSFLWWYPATISVILSLCVHSISYSPFQLRWKTSFQCKVETQGLWSPVVFCSGAPCLKQSSSPHPTQLLRLTVQNFP